MSVHFDGAGIQAERIAQQQFNGVLAVKLEDQYKDIDLFVQGKDKEWRSVSVKDQLWSSGHYGTIQIELALTNTRNGQEMPGCFYSNQADYYFWRVDVKGSDCWLVIECSKMKAYVQGNIERLKKWQTRAVTEEKNRKYGRQFDRASGVGIPVAELIALGKLMPVKGV